MKSIKLAILGLAFATLAPAVSFAQTGGINIPLPGGGVTTTASTTIPTSTTVTTTNSTTTAGTGNNNNDDSSNGNSNNNSNKNLTCSPSLQTVETGTLASVRLSGGNGTYSISAPGYTAINTDNNRFSFTYKTPGRKSVVATSGSQEATCVIEVTGASLVAAGATEAEQVTVSAEKVADEDSAPMTWWPWILIGIVAIVAIAAIVRSRSTKA